MVHSVLLIGDIQEIEQFNQQIPLTDIYQIQGVLLCEDFYAAQGYALQNPDKRIFLSIDQIPKDVIFNDVIDLGDRLEDIQDLMLSYEPLHFKRQHLSRFFQAVEELNDSEYYRRMLKIISEYATEGIQIADAEGNYIYCNDASYRITGATREEREGRNVFDVQPDGAIYKVLTEKRPIYAHLSSPKPGKLIINNASPIYDENQEIIGAITTYNDADNTNRLAQALEQKKAEIASLQEKLDSLSESKYDFEDLIGTSDALRSCITLARRAAAHSSTVLITGESGTGKELFSHGIHKVSKRSSNPFIKVNCPAIPDTLLESELFGYEKGAFTGAAKGKPGKFELADGGSIFLDEVGDLNLVLQAKLLRVLQAREVERLGSNKTRAVDVRVIAATNQDLMDMVSRGLFRRDLYYRLDVLHIHIPPLRERREDIPLLVDHMLKKLSVPHGAVPKLGRMALDPLINYDWPGNVRELENVIAKLLMFSDSNVITRDDVMYHLRDERIADEPDLPSCTLKELERRAIEKALRTYGTTLAGKKEAALALGISLSSLYARIKRFGLE